MEVSDLDYVYSEKLVARRPRYPKRVMLSGERPQEVSLAGVLGLFRPGDVLVVNDTQVLRRRIFAKDGKEVLFLKNFKEKEGASLIWQVLFPARGMKLGDSLELPDQVELELLEKGLPQKVKVSKELPESYFLRYGEVPLPPYIQKARDRRNNIIEDQQWYQTAWAEKPGSFAAPTASLHFSQEDMNVLRKKGVKVLNVTLHVGLGTFMPVKVDNLDNHVMHSESVEVPLSTWQEIEQARKERRKIWALGTTVTRSLEALAQGHLQKSDHGFGGETDLLIQPGFEFQVVDNLLTNFHQPRSTLLALVAAFAGLELVQSCYQWAIDKEFLLFSYGDLSVWQKRS